MSDIHLCPTYVREIFLTLPGHTMSDILQTYAGGRKLALDVWVSRFASNLVRGLPIDVHVRDLFFSCQAVSNSRKSAVVLYFYIAVIIQLLLHVCTCLRYLGMHAYTTHLVVSLTYVSTDMSTCMSDICPDFSMSGICLTVCRHICLTVCLTYVQIFLCLTYVRHKHWTYVWRYVWHMSRVYVWHMSRQYVDIDVGHSMSDICPELSMSDTCPDSMST